MAAERLLDADEIISDFIEANDGGEGLKHETEFLLVDIMHHISEAMISLNKIK
jgi:hypothetical protein